MRLISLKSGVILAAVMALPALAMASKAEDARRVLGLSGVYPMVNPNPAEANHTFPSMNVFATSADFTFTPFDVSGAPAGSYNYIDITMDWQASSGGPWSTEALFSLVDSTGFNTIHKYFLTPFAGAADDENPVTLTYSGYLSVPYNGGDPLELVSLQAYDPSDANWNNFSMTISQAADPTAPAAISAMQGGQLAGSIDAMGEIDYYKFDYDGGALSLNTTGSAVFDTMLVLYSAGGGISGFNDDIDFAGNNWLSEIILEPGDLPAGEYYLGVMTWGEGNTFDDGFIAFSDGEETGGYVVNGISMVVPEPTTLAVLSSLGLIALRRRR